MNGNQRPGQYFAHAQDDLNLLTLRMLEGPFFLTQPMYCTLAKVVSMNTDNKYLLADTKKNMNDKRV